MDNLLFQSMLSEAGLQDVLSGNLKTISDATQIPESTLRRYRNGSSNLESMPYRTAEALTAYATNGTDLFDIPNHYFLAGDMFNRVLERTRTNCHQMDEVYNAQIYFNWQQQLYLNGQESAPKPRYFFIKNYNQLLKDKPSLEPSLETIISIGLMYGIRFIFNMDNIPADFIGLQGNLASVVTGPLLKQITMPRLAQMSKTLDQYDGVVIDGNIHETNFKTMLMRDLDRVTDQYNVFTSVLRRFIESNNSERLLGFIMLDTNQRLVFVKEWFKLDAAGKVIGTQLQPILDSLSGVILHHFDAHTYDKDLARYIEN